MRKYKFVCLDDEDTVTSLIKTLNKRTALFQIKLEYPKPFPKQVEDIIALDKTSSIDGLILDLRLDQAVGEGQTQADYRAGSLAQEIRTLATEGKLSPFPVFLWSIDTKLSKSFNRDNTIQDLFDIIILKEEFPEKATVIATQLASVAKAYKDIETSMSRSKGFSSLLKLKEENDSLLDPRIGEEFFKSPKSFPVHAYAKYILNQIVITSGPLVDEATICARLGLDVKKSEDVSKLMKMLEPKCLYKGPFGDGWRRWWWQLVEKWWLQLGKDMKPMTSLPASDRVDILKTKTGLKRLAVAKPFAEGYGNYFSTVCQVLGFPLDPIDGFVVASTGKLPWQDKSYISREAALNRAKYNVQLELDPFERERLQTLKKLRGPSGTTS
jgi:hypothetical protein